MRVECPNCSTIYEVPAVHFVDGARRLRCTQCGYRWNQSASSADLNESKKSTPLLDMLEPAMNMEASAAVNVDIIGEDADPAVAQSIAAELDPQRADQAFGEIDEALAPMPAPSAEQEIAMAGRRWQWGLGLVAATVLVSALVLGREAVVSAAPVTQGLYRTVGLEPWSDLRRWDLCLANADAAELRYNLTNTSAFRRGAPELFVTDDAGNLARLEGPSGSLRAGETIRGAASLAGFALSKPETLSLSTKTDQSDARAFSRC